jgi:HlyD family secretion protein
VPGGATTPDELDKARRQAEIDRRTADAAQARRNAAVAGSRSEDILSAHARAASAVAKRDQVRSNLERLTIRAPIAGEILQSKYRAGEYETPGAGQDPLIVMGDTRELRVRLDVDERDIGKVSPNAAAFVTADAYPGRKFAGHVTEIGKRMGRKNVRTDDPTERIDTKILEVVITLDERDGLIPGLRVSGYVISASVR